MKYEILIILDGHVVIIALILLSWIIEISTRLKLLFHDFNWKKSEIMAHGSANVVSILYFLTLLGYMLFDIFVIKSAPEDFSFFLWFIIAIFLTIVVRIIYFKLQAKDFTKKGFHYE